MTENKTLVAAQPPSVKATTTLRLHDINECLRNALAHEQVVRHDADYVLRWLRQSKAPQNIIYLQARVLRRLALTTDELGSSPRLEP